MATATHRSKRDRKRQTEVEVDARASWGAGVLRPYTYEVDGEYEVMG
jgi:hypothetical protein